MVGKGFIRQTIISHWHNTLHGGHSGVEATLKISQTLFYWKDLRKDVKAYVLSCDVCQKNKADLAASPGLLSPLPIPDTVWSQINMDFIDGLPKVKGYEVIMVVVDRLSKYVQFIALKHPYTAQTWPGLS